MPEDPKVGDLVTLKCPVPCDDDVDYEPGARCEIVYVYPGGNTFEVRFAGARVTHVVTRNELELGTL